MKRILTALLLTLMTTLSLHAAAPDTRAYELRVYSAAPGKLDDLNKRFRDHTGKLFGKHGMVNIGYWVPQENPDRKLIYIIAHASRAAAKKSWTDFMADPDWKAAQKASEVNGGLVAKVDSTFLTAADYSPAIKPAAAKENRVFELRTYTASKGNLAALNDRFRHHTLALFTKHGMEHVGYWTPLEARQGADHTLLYIIAHQSKAAAEASFKSFRADPDWIAAKEASEKKAGGPLTEGGMAGVKSVFMNPTDYSQTK